MKRDPIPETAAPSRAKRTPRPSSRNRQGTHRTPVEPRERHAPERMSRVDTAWLRMDSDVNLMMIVGVWLMEPAIEYGALCRRVEEKLLQYPRFRQRVVRDAGGASWVMDAEVDLARHVVRERLHVPRGGTERSALQRRAGELAHTPLDASRPLWQFHLVESYEGGSAMIARIHHCIGDGIALTSVMLGITDGGIDPPQRGRRGAGTDRDEGVLDAVLRPLGALSSKALTLYGAGLHKWVGLLADPQQGLAGALAKARIAAQVARDIAAMAAMPDDSATRLKGRPSGRKKVAWSDPIPLDGVKAVGKALGCSINDVLLASVAGAIGAWLRGLGDDPDGQEIRAMVPVNLRPLDEAWQLGNRFGLAPLVLPIGIENPIARVAAVRARMNELKSSYQPLLAFAVLSVAGLMAKPVQDAILGLFAKKATAVMTNVPGPAVPLELCGATLRQTMFWVPASGDIGVGVSILSYGGGVQFGLITDEALCADPQAVIDRFGPEFEKLLLLTMMLPWA
jgi:diacylglycerol O-acyltransferase